MNEPGANKKQIEKEYRDAKKQYAAEMRTMREWDERAGILPKREEFERLMMAERHAKVRLVKTKPTSPAGAGAMVKYVQRDLEDGEDFWHTPALRTVAAALARM